MSRAIVRYFSVFAPGKMAQAVALVILFGMHMLRISTGTGAFVIFLSVFRQVLN
jgi:hypothetical protein